MPNLQTEKQLQHSIVETLNYSGALCWITNAGQARMKYTLKRAGPFQGQAREYFVRFGPAGMSDIIGIYKGRFLAIEVKLPERRGNVTAIQQNFIDNIKDWGGITGVATSVEEALAILTTKPRISFWRTLNNL